MLVFFCPVSEVFKLSVPYHSQEMHRESMPCYGLDARATYNFIINAPRDLLGQLCGARPLGSSSFVAEVRCELQLSCDQPALENALKIGRKGHCLSGQHFLISMPKMSS